MKIIESQSALLTNYEVYTHLTNQRASYEAPARKRRGPGNLETVVKEMLDYLRTPPSPLGSSAAPLLANYGEHSLRTLLTRLRPYELTKAEVVMVMNLRPTEVSALNTVVEEMEQRFPDDAVQQQIVDIIADVLGRPDGDAERRAMEASARDARDRSMDEAEDETGETRDAEGTEADGEVRVDGLTGDGGGGDGGGSGEAMDVS